MVRYGRRVMFVVVALAAAACGSLGTGSTFTDGIGDTAAGAPPTVYDITRVVTRRIDNAPISSDDLLQVEVGFLQFVLLSPPGSSGDVAGTQLQFGLIFNTDQNTSTGGTWGCDVLGIYAGVEYFVDSTFISGRLFDGTYAIRQNIPGFPLTGQASVSTVGSTLTVQVPLAALGNDDGATSMGVWAGNRNGGTPNTTDCAPTPPSSIVTRERTPFSGPRPAP
jgi:hypothetical protein